MRKGRLFKRFLSVAMAAMLVAGLTITANLTSALASNEAPSDHTPESGMELPAGVVNLVSNGDFSKTLGYTPSGDVVIEDNMLKLSEGSYFHMAVGNVSANTTYVVSYYVWTVGDKVNYDMDFQGDGSPNHTEAIDGYVPSYVQDVFANWKTETKIYEGIESCTIDGEETAESITNATEGWKKVEVSWIPDQNGTLYIDLGGYNGKGAVEGTVYIDDLMVYAKVDEVHISAAYGSVNSAAKQLIFNVTETGGVFQNSDYVLGGAKRGWYDCSMIVDGKATPVQVFIGDDDGSGLKMIRFGQTGVADALEHASTIKIPAKITLTQKGVNTVLDFGTETLLEKKNGSWILEGEELPDSISLSTGLSFYKVLEDKNIAYTILNEEVKNAFSNKAFTGNLTVDGVVQEVTWNISGQCFVISNIAAQAKKLEVVSGTKLIGENGNTIVLTNGVINEKKDGRWIVVSGDAVKLSTDLNLYKINDKMIALAYTNAEIKKLPEGMSFDATILIDKTNTPVVMQKSGNCFVITSKVDDGSFMRFAVPKGTKLTAADGSVITITNELKYVKLEGTWMEDYGQTKIEYNDVKISYHSFDGRGFYLLAEIVAGPDKGKTMGEAYGSWMSRAEGKAYFDGKEMTINFSPNTDYVYISGNYDPEMIQEVLIKKGTVFIPYSGAQNKTYMRTTNKLELAKDNVYNRWGKKGEIKTPTEFHEVTVSMYNITGVKVAMIATPVDGSTKTVQDIYGAGALCYGSVTYGDPKLGTYTDDNAGYYMSGNQILLMNKSIGLMDTITIKKGTILWPTADCESQKPIRIMNTIKLTRDENDEWVYKVAGASQNLGGNHPGTATSPQTGDALLDETYAYIMLMLLAVMVVCGSVYQDYKFRKKNR